MDWARTDGADDRLRELLAQGHTFREIATIITDEFGTLPSGEIRVLVTRNSAIGRAHRLGLMHPDGVPPRDRRPPQQRAARLARRRSDQETRRAQAMEAAAAIPEDDQNPGVSFFEIRSGQCRELIRGFAQDREGAFCGAPMSKFGSVYCDRHAAKNYSVWPPKGRMPGSHTGMVSPLEPVRPLAEGEAPPIPAVSVLGSVFKAEEFDDGAAEGFKE